MLKISSLPHDFLVRMQAQLGDEYADFLASYEKERTFGLRYNPLKIKKDAFVQAMAQQGIALTPVPWAEEGFYYEPDARPGRTALHEAGACYIQEPSAMAVAALAEPQPGERVCDLCAAPGGKSTQLAARMQGKGLLVANEIVPARAKILSQNIERMGVGNAVVCNETVPRLAERFPFFFDRIVVDAPCSGEGMFRKDEHACGEWSLSQVELCADRQRDILSCAADMLKPGGILVYSTCTFAPQEDAQMSAWFVKTHPQFALEKEVQLFPHRQKGEGHYAARFRKEGTLSADILRVPDTGVKKKKSRKKQAAERTPQELLYEFCRRTLTEQTAEQIAARVDAGRLLAFGDALYLLPDGIDSLAGLKVERAGLCLGTCKKNRFEPSHAFAMALGPAQVQRSVEPPEPERYLAGETFPCQEKSGWLLVSVCGCSLGWGKAANGIVKNHYPKGLRRSFA